MLIYAIYILNMIWQKKPKDFLGLLSAWLTFPFEAGPTLFAAAGINQASASWPGCSSEHLF